MSRTRSGLVQDDCCAPPWVVCEGAAGKLMALSWQPHFEPLKTVELALHASIEKSKTTSYHLRHLLYVEPRARPFSDPAVLGMIIHPLCVHSQHLVYFTRFGRGLQTSPGRANWIIRTVGMLPFHPPAPRPLSCPRSRAPPFPDRVMLGMIIHHICVHIQHLVFTRVGRELQTSPGRANWVLRSVGMLPFHPPAPRPLSCPRSRAPPFPDRVMLGMIIHHICVHIQHLVFTRVGRELAL